MPTRYQWLRQAIVILAEPAARQAAHLDEIMAPLIGGGSAASYGNDELALSLDDFFHASNDMIQHGELTEAEAAMIRPLDELLNELSGEHNADFWRREALDTDARWDEVRALARSALAGLPDEERAVGRCAPMTDARTAVRHRSMKPPAKYIFVVLAACAFVVLLGGAIWYWHDRAGMLGALCKAGLPNLSRPSIVEAEDLGCDILGPRRRVTGTLLTGFEASNLIENDLPPPPEGGGFTGSTWMTCSQQKGCDKRLNHQLDQKIPGLCESGLASIVAYGWATETPGNYGHLGIFAREFFVDDIVAVGPPPASIVSHLRRQLSEPGIGGCP